MDCSDPLPRALFDRLPFPSEILQHDRNLTDLESDISTLLISRGLQGNAYRYCYYRNARRGNTL